MDARGCDLRGFECFYLFIKLMSHLDDKYNIGGLHNKKTYVVICLALFPWNAITSNQFSAKLLCGRLFLITGVWGGLILNEINIVCALQNVNMRMVGFGLKF